MDTDNIAVFNTCAKLKRLATEGDISLSVLYDIYQGTLANLCGYMNVHKSAPSLDLLLDCGRINEAVCAIEGAYLRKMDELVEDSYKPGDLQGVRAEFEKTGSQTIERVLAQLHVMSNNFEDLWGLYASLKYKPNEPDEQEHRNHLMASLTGTIGIGEEILRNRRTGTSEAA